MIVSDLVPRFKLYKKEFSQNLAWNQLMEHVARYKHALGCSLNSVFKLEGLV